MTQQPSILCSRCAHDVGPAFVGAACPACDGLLEARVPSPPARATALQQLFDSRVGPHAMRGSASDGSGVWRFRELVLDIPPSEIVSLAEGNTPLLDCPGLAKLAHVGSLRLKHEGRNPTGSFKDRGMTVAISHAKRCSARAVACASTGNTSSSMAAFAARAGMPALVLVPLGKISPGKLAQTVAYGAQTLLVRGDFDDCLRLVREAARSLSVYLANSVNPYRIEGQKTIILELLQQCAWCPPDWIAFPAGNLGNTSAFGKALREAKELGLIDRVPRLLAVQAAGAAPFAAAFAEGFSRRHTVKAQTIATAIRIGDPASWDRAVVAIRETDGVVAAVTDEEIMAAKGEIDRSGIGCEPASAATLAGIRSLANKGIIAPDASVAGILTGHMLKDHDAMAQGGLEDSRAAPLPPNEIDGTLAEIEVALSKCPQQAGR